MLSRICKFFKKEKVIYVNLKNIDSIILSYLGSNDILQICSFYCKNKNSKIIIQMKYCNTKRKKILEQKYNIIIKAEYLIEILIFHQNLYNNPSAIPLIEETM